MPKKKVIAARDLKDCLPNLPLKKGKAKKKIKIFLSRQFCASLEFCQAACSMKHSAAGLIDFSLISSVMKGWLGKLVYLPFSQALACQNALKACP
jgi:hypothetical protein